MNSLSWLIYLSEVSGGLVGLFIACTVILSLLILVCLIAAGISSDSAKMNMRSGLEHYANENLAVNKTCWKVIKRSLMIFPICLFFSIAIPSKQTVMLIAASEMTETFVTETGLVDPSVKFIKKWMENQITEMSETAKKSVDR